MSARSRPTSEVCMINERAEVDARARDFLLLYRRGAAFLSRPIQGKFRAFYTVYSVNYTNKTAKSGDYCKIL